MIGFVVQGHMLQATRDSVLDAVSICDVAAGKRTYKLWHKSQILIMRFI